MICATMRMAIAVKNHREALGMLKPVIHRARYAPGCLSYRVYRDVESEDVIMIEELWSSQEDLERHLRSDEYYRVLLVLDMASAPPEISFNQIATSTGFETIERVRTAQGGKARSLNQGPDR